MKRKFIFEVFNSDKYICSVLSDSLDNAIIKAKLKVSFNPIVINTGHCIN